MPTPIASASSGAPVISLDAARQARPEASGPAQEMDQDVFLKLLVTQLQNQDPSSPMDTNQMVSQAAQLSMTETLNGMADVLKSQSVASSMSTAAALIGRQAQWLQDGLRATATVTGALFQDGQALVELDGGSHTIPLDRITALDDGPLPVRDRSTPTAPEQTL